MIKHKVANKLGSDLKGNVVVTSEQNAEMLRSQANFYASTIETIRRELVIYGVAVSSLGEKTRV